jgi:hypothetical protein
MQIEAAMNNPEECELLSCHLAEVHVEMRTIEKVARYDEEAAEVLKIERIRRLDIEKGARELIVKFARWGHKPRELEDLILLGYRYKLAIARGWPGLPGNFSGSYSHQSPNSLKQHNLDETENNSPE